MDVEVRYRDEGVAIGTCGCVVIFAWRGDVTLERVVAADPILHERAAACRSIGLLSVVEHGSAPPGPEAARQIRGTLEDLHDRVAGAAIVFEGGSSWLAMALDAIAAVAAAMRRRVAQKHTVDREEACLWVHRRCVAAGEVTAPSREDLAGALARVQAAIGAD